MAINPNTNFTAGAVLTADQQNRFPRGVMALTARTTNVNFGSETTIVSATFTAVASRNYKITWFEPKVSNSGTNGYSVCTIKNNTTTIWTANLQQAVALAGYIGEFVYIGTFSAGSVTINCTMISTNTGTAGASATERGFLCIEDIGPA